jgi:hypothetical protein
MNTFRIWNRVPPSGEWHLSGKRLVGRVLVTRRFAAGWAAQSDSYLGNRSWVGSALGAYRVELPHGMGLLSLSFNLPG